MRTIVLDNEPVQALLSPTHPKHRIVAAHLAGVVARRKKGATVRVVASTAVRVEAGWDRSDPRSAAINRFRVIDAPLDSETANVAAAVVGQTGVSVADAHIGAVARSTDGDVVVLTSDLGDMTIASAPRPITAIRI